MTVYSNKEVLYGKIEYRRQKVPYGSFFLSDGIDVSPDDEIKIIGNYKGSTSTRTIVSGINGVTAVGTDNFTSSGVTFSTSGIVAGDMLIIKGSGSDAGCYIVDTVDSETQLSLDDHAGVPVSFSGDTTLEYEVGLIIFRGIIDKTDFEANQTIEVFSATEEITQERPIGSYYGYSEVIVGEMISQSSLGNTNINYTESTLTIYPNADAAKVGDVDDPAPANNDDIMWNDLDGGTDGEYIHIRESVIPFDYLELGFTNHSLSGDYHYNIYKVVVNFRNKYHPDNTGASFCLVDFYDGLNWYYDKDPEKINDYGLGGQTWHDTSITFDGLNITEDDINNFKVLLGVYAPMYGIEEGNIIDWVNVTVYYRYYDDFIDAGSYKHSLVCSGEKTIADYANLYAIDEQMTWYLDTSLYFYFRNADGDSGEDFAKTDYMKNIIGDRNNKTYSRVILFGGYTTGVQMTSSTGSGFPLWKDTYSTINDQTQLDNLAAAILTEQSANQYVIQIYREDSTDGLYQVGETVTLPADPNQIKFSDSDRLIPAGQYILNKIDYILNDGQYLILDIEIIDGLIFSNPRQDNTTGSNAENIANEATVQIAQVGGGESIGEANTGQNIGSDGVGVYDGKSGVTLQFRNIAPASNKVTVVENGNDIDIDVDPTNIYTDAEAVAAVLADDAYLKLVGDTMGGAINMNSNNITGVNTIVTLGVANYDKFRVWTNPAYTIGLMDAMTYGGLNNYAMTFTVYHTVDRGWVWRDDDDAKNDGAMSLTTAGVLTVKGASTFQSSLQVDGNITTNGTVDGVDIATRDHAPTVAGDLNHNDLANLNAGDVYEHISQAQKDALHAAYTNADADARIALANHDTLLNPNGNADEQHMTAAQIAALHPKQHAMDDATEHTSSDITTLNSSTTKHGFLKKLDNVSTNFMNGQGNWSVPGVTEADVYTYLGINVANKRWINCIFGGENSATKNLDIFDAIRNVSATDSHWVMEIPLPYIIGIGAKTKNLIITKIRIGITDSDAGNYVDRIRMGTWNTASPPGYAGLVDIDHDTVHGTGVGKFEHNHADQTIGGTYERVALLIDAVTTTTAFLDIAYVKVEYYYV